MSVYSRLPFKGRYERARMFKLWLSERLWKILPTSTNVPNEATLELLDESRSKLAVSMHKNIELKDSLKKNSKQN